MSANDITRAGKLLEKTLNDGVEYSKYKVIKTPHEYGRVTVLNTDSNKYRVIELDYDRVDGSKKFEVPWSDKYTVDPSGYAIEKKSGLIVGKVYIKFYDKVSNYRKSYKPSGKYSRNGPFIFLVDTKDQVSIDQLKNILK